MAQRNNRGKIVALYVLAAVFVLAVVAVILIVPKGFGTNTVAGTDEAGSEASAAELTSDVQDAVADAAQESSALTAPAVSTMNISDPGFPTASYTQQVNAIDQYPELPTGCESVALTIDLESMGYLLGKTTISDYYMTYSDEDFVDSYVGDPSSYDGVGAYAPAITTAANRFLADQGSTAKAHNITGSTWDELLEYVEKGYPVIIWTTIDGGDPDFTDTVYEGWPWYDNEHCVVLYGIDQGTGIVSISDPTYGDTQYNSDDYRWLYDACMRMAVVIY